MPDGRKNNGGANRNQGRKKKAIEESVSKLSLNAIVTVHGGLDNYFQWLAKEGKSSFPHAKMLHEYAFGKVPETINQRTEIVVPDINWDE